MSRLFFKGRQEKRETHENHGYESKGSHKPGSKKYPLELVVTSEDRKTEVAAIVNDNQFFANITVNSDDEAQENILELNGLLNKPKTLINEKTPNRNDPCSCGSGKKYKKCCA